MGASTLRVFTLTALALSISALSTVAQADPQSQEYIPLTLKASSEQAQANGFIDGQSLSGTTRNWYARERAARAPLWRYYKSDGTRHATHSRENWLQGTILNYSSGFTQGTVGFAVEAAGYNAIALHRAARPSPAPTTARSPTAMATPSASGASWAWGISRRACPTPPLPSAVSRWTRQ